MIINLFYILLSLALLWKGSDWLVESSIRIASFYRVPQLIIGLTIVAFGTSAPEFVVTIGAALNGQSDISVSNVIGSNIYNLGFILGGVAMIRAIHADRKLIYRDGVILAGITLLTCLFLIDLNLSRVEGGILLFGLIVYNLYLVRQKEDVEIKTERSKSILLDWLLLLLSLGLVIIGGMLLRNGAVGIAREIGISDWIIGVTLIAGGTSAPEFATSLMASHKGHHGLSAGNLIGSCTFNLLGVLGLAGLLRPLVVDRQAIGNGFMMLAIVLFAMIFFRTGWKLSRREGLILVIISLCIWGIMLFGSQ